MLQMADGNDKGLGVLGICRRNALSLFWTAGFRLSYPSPSPLFVTIHHISQTSTVSDIVSESFQPPDAVISERIWFFPTGCWSSGAFRQVYIAMQFPGVR